MSDFKRYLNIYTMETLLPGTGETVKFRPINTGQIKKLMMYDNMEESAAIEDALDDLITECVTSEGFDITKIYLQDRFFLLLEIRRATKGNKYSFNMVCDECHSQSVQDIDLNVLKVTTLKKPEEKPVVTKPGIAKKKAVIQVKDDRIEVKKPELDNWNVVKINDNLSLRLQLVTVGIEKNARNSMSSLEGLSDVEKQITLMDYINAMCIKSVITPEGEDEGLSIEDKIYLLNNIVPDEMMKITEWFSAHDFGIDFTLKIVCPHCKNTVDREIPLESFFF